ncbi:hypothetical protein CF140_14745 [Aeromonas sobria]|nr:hypothetical protein CF140_14745 [Aeromonas sobria]
MSSKIYFNTRRFSPSKWLLGIGTRLHHRFAPTHAKRTASKLLLTPQRNQRDWRQEMDPWRAVYRLYGLYLADQVFNDLELCQDPARHFWPEVDALLSSWR